MAVATWGYNPGHARFPGATRPLQLGHGAPLGGRHRLEDRTRGELATIRTNARAYNARIGLTRGQHRMPPRKFATIRAIDPLAWISFVGALLLTIWAIWSATTDNSAWFSAAGAGLLWAIFATHVREAREQIRNRRGDET